MATIIQNLDTILKLIVPIIVAIVGTKYLHKDTVPNYKYGVAWYGVWMRSLVCAVCFTVGTSFIILFTNDSFWVVSSMVIEIPVNAIILILYHKRKVVSSKTHVSVLH